MYLYSYSHLKVFENDLPPSLCPVVPCFVAIDPLLSADSPETYHVTKCEWASLERTEPALKLSVEAGVLESLHVGGSSRFAEVTVGEVPFV